MDGAYLLLLEDNPKGLELCAEAAGARDRDSAAPAADETRADRNLFIATKLALTARLCSVTVQTAVMKSGHERFRRPNSRSTAR